jgi:hypothetical protein
MIEGAKYSTINVPVRYHGIPWIEALPGVATNEECWNAMARKPTINLALSRTQPTHLRAHDVSVLDELFVPHPIAMTVAQNVGMMIRQSYCRRPAFDAREQARIYNMQKELELERLRKSDAPHEGQMILNGLSGVGKTRLCNAVLRTFPRAIRHTNYQGMPLNYTQVVWISVHAPIGDSVKGLLLGILKEIDLAVGTAGTPASIADSNMRAPLETLVLNVAQAASTCRLGLLHVDDLQRIAESKQRLQAIQLIIQIANVVRCPVVFSATPEVMGMFQSSFEATRRAISRGNYLLKKAPSHDDPHFVALVKTALEYQWLDDPLVCDEKVIKYLFDKSAGITSIVILLCQLAQQHALFDNQTSLKLKHFEDVYELHLTPLHKALRGLQNPTQKSIAEYERSMADFKNVRKEKTAGDNTLFDV